MKDEGDQPPASLEEIATEPSVNGVVVTRGIDEHGNLIIDVSHLGDVKITEVQTILELGVKRFREVALGQKPS